MKVKSLFILPLNLAITVFCFDTFEDAVIETTCRFENPEIAYVMKCIETFRKIDVLEVEANANATFLCRDVNYIVLTHNPGVFVIERRVKNGTWSDAIVSNGTKILVGELWQNTSYQYRLHRIFENGFSLPEITDFIKTLSLVQRPRDVSNITVKSFKPEPDEPLNLTSEISFLPSPDRTCYYQVFLASTANDPNCTILEEARNFDLVYSKLKFGMKYTIQITASTSREMLSDPIKKTFRTPTCLQVFNNLTTCAPDDVQDLNAIAIHKVGNIFDVNVTWAKPNLIPDFYTVYVLPVTSKTETPIARNVSGNATETLFPNVRIVDQFDVIIDASSRGGKGPQIMDTFTIDPEALDIRAPITSNVGTIVIILLASVVLVLGTGVYAYHRNGNRRRTEMLQSLDQKERPLDTIKDIEDPRPTVLGVKDLLTPVDEYEISPDRLELKRPLGSGAFGIVKLGILRDDRGQVTTVAVKMLRDDPSEEDQRGFELEIKIMKSAGQHPNIVSLLGCCTIGPRSLLVVEYCSRGDLQSFLRSVLERTTMWVRGTKKQCTLKKFIGQENTEENLFPHLNCSDEENDPRVTSFVTNRAYDIDQDQFCDSDVVTIADLLNFGRQVATGMEFLSSNRVVHRDLAARNVLVCNDRTVKISDFGLSRDIYQENVYKKQSNGRLPVKWMAIEALTHQVYSTYSDVWSFGILLWEIVTLGSSPYPEIPTNEVLRRLKSGYRMERPPNCSVPLYNVMLSCWRVKPRDRPTFTILREELDKLLCATTDNEYLDLNEISKGSSIEDEDSKILSPNQTALPAHSKYVNDNLEPKIIRQEKE